jgi:CRISPR type I-E-associated protein CasB/Cse2
MSFNPATEQYIKVLLKLKAGDLGLLRLHAGQGIDQSLDAFDLFSGLWWPLRQKSPKAPRREVAWLIAKLFAFRPLPQSADDMLARQIAKCRPVSSPSKERFAEKFDRLLTLPLSAIEPDLQWALGLIESHGLKLDWAQLTDDLSLWERESTRCKWASQFLSIDERSLTC